MTSKPGPGGAFVRGEEICTDRASSWVPILCINSPPVTIPVPKMSIVATMIFHAFKGLRAGRSLV